jgi:outer membrane protein
MRSRVQLPAFVSLSTVSLVALSGCTSPIDRDSEQVLKRSMLNAIEREIAHAEMHPEQQRVSPSLDLQKLEIREDHLEEISRDFSPDGYLEQLKAEHPDASSPIAHLIGEDLLGQETTLIGLSLEQTIQSSVGNNLSVEIARFAPAIAQAALTEAEAQFDWLFFAEGQFQDSSIPQAGQGFGGSSGEIRVNSENATGSVGVQRQFNSGGTLEIRNDIGYSNVDSSFFGSSPTPNPAHNADFVLGLTQPLMRGFGRDANMAQINLARNAERTSVSQLKSTLIDTAADTENAYWDLVQAYKVLIIRAKLLDRGIEVRDDIKARRVQDARQAQVADAVARVERRRADLLVARTNLRLASDRLKVLINDPQLPVGSETLIVPSQDALAEPIGFSLLDAITAGVQERPEMEQSLLSIDDATIREQLAKNQRMPRLDLTAQARLLGFDDSFGDAYQNTGETRFVDDWLIGARFEQPIGNRAGEAAYRASRLERMQSVVAYRQTAQQIVLQIKNALNQVTTNGSLIEQSTLSRVAQGEALRSLIVEKELTNAGYSVERLNLELNQQESLANAEIAEASALTDYNKAIVDLHAAMGTILQRSRIDFIVPDANQLAPGESALEYGAEDDAEEGRPEAPETDG